MSIEGRERGRSTLSLLVAAAIINSMPTVLMGALFVQIAASTGAPIAALGGVVGIWWAAAALVSNLSGALAHRLGSDTVALIAVGLAIVSLLGIAFGTPDWPLLFVWAVIGGSGVALGGPSASHLMTERIPVRRMAFAFGMRQGAIPLSSLLAGLAIPAIALTIGWQWAFVFAAAAGVILIIVFRRVLPRTVEPDSDEPRGRRPPLDPELRRYLILVAAFALLASGALSFTTAFAVTSAIHRGISPGLAGVILAVAGLGGVVARVAVGVLADRGVGGTLKTMAFMIAAATVGLSLVAIQTPWTLAIGLFIAMSYGWGWPGLLHYFVAKRAGAATVTAASIISIGNFVGSGGAPFLLGFVYSENNDSLAWIIAAAMTAVSAVGSWLLSSRDRSQV